MTKIRKATLRDAGDISRIVCLCYEGFGQTDGYPSNVIAELKETRGSAKCIRELIENEHVFVADDEGRIKGMVSIKDNEITKLYIDPHYQRKGIGKQLFTYAESFIRSHGYQDMFLGVVAQTPLPFYGRMGMRIARKRIVEWGPCVGMTVAIIEKAFDTRQHTAADG